MDATTLQGHVDRVRIGHIDGRSPVELLGGGDGTDMIRDRM